MHVHLQEGYTDCQKGFWDGRTVKALKLSSPEMAARINIQFSDWGEFLSRVLPGLYVTSYTDHRQRNDRELAETIQTKRPRCTKRQVSQKQEKISVIGWRTMQVRYRHIDRLQTRLCQKDLSDCEQFTVKHQFSAPQKGK